MPQESNLSEIENRINNWFANEDNLQLLRTYFGRKIPSQEIPDLIQNTYLSAITGHRYYDPQRPLGYWIIGVSINQRIDYLRKEHHIRQKIKPIFVYIDGIKQPEIPDASSIKKLERKLNIDKLNEYLQTVDERSRTMLLMRLDGLNNKQIGEKLNLRPHTVSDYISRTISYLASQFSSAKN